MLAFWRSLYPVGLPGVRDKDYGRAVERFAVNKAGQAKAERRDDDAARVLATAADIRQAHDAKRREDDALNRSVSRALGFRTQ